MCSLICCCYCACVSLAFAHQSLKEGNQLKGKEKERCAYMHVPVVPVVLIAWEESSCSLTQSLTSPPPPGPRSPNLPPISLPLHKKTWRGLGDHRDATKACLGITELHSFANLWARPRSKIRWLHAPPSAVEKRRGRGEGGPPYPPPILQGGPPYPPPTLGGGPPNLTYPAAFCPLVSHHELT